MGIITKEVEVKITKRNLEHFINKGYNAELYKLLLVKTIDLQPRSKINVELECDYCHKHFIVPFSSYSNSIKYINKTACYDKHCRAEKTKETNMLRYNVENTMQLNEVKEKVQNTLLEKYGEVSYLKTDHCKECRENFLFKNYGVDIPTKSPIILNKIHETNLKKYGVRTPMESEEFKRKHNDSMLNKYGYKCVGHVPEFHDKRQKTCMERYGVLNPVQSTEIQNKIKSYWIDNYGVTNPMQIHKIKEKQMHSLYLNGTAMSSKQQRYICTLYDGLLNYPIGLYFADIYLPHNNIICEFDGSGHNLNVKKKSITQEEFDKKEIIRNSVIKREGYKQMRIISTKDFLPSDTILLQMLTQAKEYFSNYPEHSWIEYNIDTSTVRNAEQKDGVFFDYGKLRKIKKSDSEKESDENCA